MSPGQESPVPEEQELHRPSRGKGARREVEQDPGGRGCPRAPGTLTDTCAPGECAELPKGCSARRDPEQLEGGGRRKRLRGAGCGAGAAGGARAEEEAPGGGGCAVPGAARRGSGGGSAEGAARPGSANPTAQAPEHRGRDTAQDPASPRDRQRPGGPRTARTLLPRAEQISGPAPEPPGPGRGI